jgi:hypothetical protein
MLNFYFILFKSLEYTRDGAYWRQDKSRAHFTHECVKRTQIANLEWTRSEPRANAEETQSKRRGDWERTQSERKIFKSKRRANPGSESGVRSGFAMVLGCVRSVLYLSKLGFPLPNYGQYYVWLNLACWFYKIILFLNFQCIFTLLLLSPHGEGIFPSFQQPLNSFPSDDFCKSA